MARAGEGNPLDTRRRNGSASTESVKSWRLVQVAKEGPSEGASRFEGLEAQKSWRLERPTKRRSLALETPQFVLVRVNWCERFYTCLLNRSAFLQVEGYYH